MTSLPVLLQIPGIVLVLGSLLLPFFRKQPVLQGVVLIALPLLSFAHMMGLPLEHAAGLTLFDFELSVVEVDKLSRVWGIVFHIAALLSAIYALHLRDPVQHVAGLMYAGAAIAAAFAGDFITLFVFWELTAISSVFLIWATRTEEAYRTGLRYLLIQVGSGVLLLAGVIIHVATSTEAGVDASVALDIGRLDLQSGLGPKLILLAFGIKCAFPFLHNWLQDSYPQATVVGTVFLSAYTTKLAVYALARCFAGESLLIPIGVAMTLFPIFFAVIENDLRKVLAYSLNNQLGYMVVGVGIGTELALNGTASHAFAHIIYKGLLFMAMGAVLHRVGTVKASELGGLYKSMPLTALFCIIGSLSISGFPGTSGFVTKSMTLSAVGAEHLVFFSLLLWVASAGVVDHSGIKIPFFSFFAHDSGKRVKEAPLNMLIAMALASVLCIGIGIMPGALYSILPYDTAGYEPYTVSHIVQACQLLLFAALAFVVLMKSGLYPPEIRSINLDTDWIYRRLFPRAIARIRSLRGLRLTLLVREQDEDGRRQPGAELDAEELLARGYRTFMDRLHRLHRPVDGPLGEPLSSSNSALWATVILAAYLLLSFL